MFRVLYKKYLIFFIFISNAFVLFAGPVEDIEKARKYDGFTKVKKIYIESLSKEPSLYGWLVKSSELSPKEREELFQYTLETIPKSESLRTYLKTGGSEYGGMVRESTLHLGLTREEFLIAEKLFEAGSLRNITEVSYQGTKIPFEGIKQIQWNNFPTWIVDNKKEPLFKILMTLRDGLTSTTPLTKTELTEQMLNLTNGETGEPEIARALRVAIRNHMVKDRFDYYTSENSSRRERRIVLEINLSDPSDLELAGMLVSKGDNWSGDPNNPKIGLNDVEQIIWKGVEEKTLERSEGEKLKPGFEKVNYPKANYVYDKDGWRIIDVLDPSNFRSAPRGHGTGLWRKRTLLDRAVISQVGPYGSATKKACDLSVIVGK